MNPGRRRSPISKGLAPGAASLLVSSLAPIMARMDDPQKPRKSQCRSEEHTSELQSQFHLVCRLLLEKKNKKKTFGRFDYYRTSWIIKFGRDGGNSEDFEMS